jgi:endonuclease/exonuclease/phosphatase family metal-dependent hydrolase
LKAPLKGEDKEKLGRALVDEALIPCVFSAYGDGQAKVWTETGDHVLPEQACEVLGRDHPFLNEVAKDMIAISHHSEAGEFFICGFRKNGEAISFPNENGSHGGISAEETSAFAILPVDAPLPEIGNRSFRLEDIHAAAQEFLRGPSAPTAFVRKPPEQIQRFIRVLTYNVHNCAGNDGYISPHRIARVIKSERPDIVALQELDVGRQRTSGEDQAGLIARYLRMDHHFHAAIEIKKERYGDAILSRFPMKIMNAGILPYRKGWIVDEPRGALWVSIEIGGGIRIQVLNTHFGLWRRERILQARALLGEDYLGHPRCQGGVILCGDFNSSPGSEACRLIKTRLQDSQELLAHRKRSGTYSSRTPLYQIDHIFLNDYFEVGSVRVPKTHLARMASDHLPLSPTFALRNSLLTIRAVVATTPGNFCFEKLCSTLRAPPIFIPVGAEIGVR